MSKEYSLPKDATKLAERFGGLSEGRKGDILAHIRATPSDKQSELIHQIIKNGGDEAKFIRHVLGKGDDDEGGKSTDSPQNKRSSPPQTK